MEKEWNHSQKKKRKKCAPIVDLRRYVLGAQTMGHKSVDLSFAVSEKCYAIICCRLFVLGIKSKLKIVNCLSVLIHVISKSMLIDFLIEHFLFDSLMCAIATCAAHIAMWNEITHSMCKHLTVFWRSLNRFFFRSFSLHLHQFSSSKWP